MKKFRLFATFLLVALCTATFVSCDNDVDDPHPMVETLTGTWAVTERTETFKIDGENIPGEFVVLPQNFIFNSDSSVEIERGYIEAIRNSLLEVEAIKNAVFYSSIWRSVGNAITVTINFNVEMADEGTDDGRVSHFLHLTLINPTTLVYELTFIGTAVMDEESEEEVTVEQHVRWVFTKR